MEKGDVVGRKGGGSLSDIARVFPKLGGNAALLGEDIRVIAPRAKEFAQDAHLVADGVALCETG
ncbi:MAG: hypothetical protein H3C50_10305 [Kiritimatiellae bacterium]|nr:hypothetical protein [Kiritimatiellia bacterium]